jgi:tetratricopeptide (TPR) repeat protein
MQNIADRYKEAANLMAKGKYEESAELFMELQKINEISSACLYQLAAISNATNDPETAYDLYYRAFEEKPDLAELLFNNQHSSFGYVYNGKKQEKERIECPLCGMYANPHWCYPLVEAAGFNSFFNPIRMWMYCVNHATICLLVTSQKKCFYTMTILAGRILRSLPITPEYWGIFVQGVLRRV